MEHFNGSTAQNGVIQLNSSPDYAYKSLVFPLAAITAAGFLANAALASYIFWRRLYNNFISSHFIAHLCITNMFGLGLLVPLFLITLWSGTNIWAGSNLMCRIQVFRKF